MKHFSIFNMPTNIANDAKISNDWKQIDFARIFFEVMFLVFAVFKYFNQLFHSQYSFEITYNKLCGIAIPQIMPNSHTNIASL